MIVIVLATAAGDAFSVWILNNSTDCDVTNGESNCFGTNVFAMISLTATSPIGLIGLFFLGMLAVLMTYVQVALMVFRGGDARCPRRHLPVAASFTNTEMGRSGSRGRGWTLAFILYKPAAAIVYAIAFRMTGADLFKSDGTGLFQIVTGLALMLIALVALPALMRFLAPAVAVGRGRRGRRGPRDGRWARSRRRRRRHRRGPLRVGAQLERRRRRRRRLQRRHRLRRRRRSLGVTAAPSAASCRSSRRWWRRRQRAGAGGAVLVAEPLRLRGWGWRGSGGGGGPGRAWRWCRAGRSLRERSRPRPRLRAVANDATGSECMSTSTSNPPRRRSRARTATGVSPQSAGLGGLGSSLPG